MDHADKIQQMFVDLPRRGVGSWTFAPPAYRLLWRLGVEVPPPHFSTFSFLFAFQGSLFGLLWGLLCVVPMHVWFSGSLWLLLAASVGAGVLFGLSMAGYYRRQARSHGLPLWSDYGRA
jgi:hypothetical protein